MFYIKQYTMADKKKEQQVGKPITSVLQMYYMLPKDIVQGRDELLKFACTPETVLVGETEELFCFTSVTIIDERRSGLKVEQLTDLREYSKLFVYKCRRIENNFELNMLAEHNSGWYVSLFASENIFMHSVERELHINIETSPNKIFRIFNNAVGMKIYR